MNVIEIGMLALAFINLNQPKRMNYPLEDGDTIYDDGVYDGKDSIDWDNVVCFRAPCGPSDYVPSEADRKREQVQAQLDEMGIVLQSGIAGVQIK